MAKSKNSVFANSPTAPQTGTTSGLPFATSDGKPRPTPAAPPFNMNQQNRPQGKATAGAGPASSDVTAQNRSAPAGSPQQRGVDMRTIPKTGLVPPATSARGGTGSVGNSAKPFRMGGK